MSVATCLGFDDPKGPPSAVAAAGWQRWCHQDPDLAVVDELVDLAKWTRESDAPIADRLLARLHAMAQLDAEAASVLAWLLLPGACSLANRLADLSTEIDALVAGALWVRVRTQPTSQYVAITILRDGSPDCSRRTRYRRRC